MLDKAARWLIGLVIILTGIPALAQVPATQPADQSAIKLGRDGQPEKRFMQLHQEFLDRAKQGNIDLLFLGDSITEGWRNAQDVWTDHYGKDNPANFGIGGDRTQHVLWRIDNGELDGINPKVLVLMIGTNNTGANTADEIAAADIKIVREIHQKLPNTKVLVLGIFPRGVDPQNPQVGAVRDLINQVNTQLAKLDDGDKTRYLDIGGKFLNDDGIIRFNVMHDALHPTPAGYKIWADAMQPLLDEMLK